MINENPSTFPIHRARCEAGRPTPGLQQQVGPGLGKTPAGHPFVFLFPPGDQRRCHRNSNGHFAGAKDNPSLFPIEADGGDDYRPLDWNKGQRVRRASEIRLSKAQPG